jgi:hypothetical protein
MFAKPRSPFGKRQPRVAVRRPSCVSAGGSVLSLPGLSGTTFHMYLLIRVPAVLCGMDRRIC